MDDESIMRAEKAARLMDVWRYRFLCLCLLIGTFVAESIFNATFPAGRCVAAMWGGQCGSYEEGPTP